MHGQINKQHIIWKKWGEESRQVSLNSPQDQQGID